MAIRYEVEAVEATSIILHSELIANEELPSLTGDPRVAAMLSNPLEAKAERGAHLRALLFTSNPTQPAATQGAAMEHRIDGPTGYTTELAVDEDWARATVAARLDGVGTGRGCSRAALRWRLSTLERLVT